PMQRRWQGLRFHSHFTNSRSLPSPYALSLETLWVCSIVSRCDSCEGKGHKMPHMEIEIVRQATRRTHGLAIPRAHCLRRADRCDGFQQRAAPGKFEVKSHDSLSHNNDCKLFPLTAILPQTSRDLLATQ